MTIRELRRRLTRLEVVPGATAGQPVLFVDCPPKETREEWFARKAGKILPSALTRTNACGETRAQWVARKVRELGEERGGAYGAQFGISIAKPDGDVQ